MDFKKHGAWCFTWLLVIHWTSTQWLHAQLANESGTKAINADTHAFDRPSVKPLTLGPLESIEAWEEKRRYLIQRFSVLAGEIEKAPTNAPLATAIISEIPYKGVSLRKIEYAVSFDRRVKAWLLLPPRKEHDRKVAAVLALHQTNGPLGKDEPVGLGGKPDLHYGLELAQRGFVVLAPDYPSFGENTFDFEAQGQWPSGTMQAIWENIRAIDVLASMPEVNTNGIGCIGHSLGGHNSIFTAVIDSRIKATVSCCGFTRFHRYMNGDLAGWTSLRYMPRIRTHHHNDPNQVPFDFHELIASIAPRAFMAVAPQRDSNFDVRGVEEVIVEASRVYKLYKVLDRLGTVYPEDDHTFPESSRRIAYEFFEKHLREN